MRDNPARQAGAALDVDLETVARCLLAALEADSPEACVEPFGVDDRLLISGRFDVLAVAAAMRDLIVVSIDDHGESPSGTNAS
jgi:hypothetical protein